MSDPTLGALAVDQPDRAEVPYLPQRVLEVSGDPGVLREPGGDRQLTRQGPHPFPPQRGEPPDHQSAAGVPALQPQGRLRTHHPRVRRKQNVAKGRLGRVDAKGNGLR